ncbi:hypothetical protein PC9H_008243 [Pleurotus ostreatus]|uniref:Uncharacterized protein n=1 Tax=Pleurotus ostreatus TaxID=5322 RepID=A0A8H7DTI1_PLEOS|nr:uncharacterized protein PC9H_008243 [Pleurotus ostreatus]KAF7429005.1 hypothetical protein PC9H_008243 [Pleurotus ostreatus]
MCLNDNSATLSARYLSAQLSAMWQNAVECVETEHESAIIDLRSEEYDKHKYKRGLAQWHYGGRRVPKGGISKDSLFFYGSFDEPRLEFVCNHEVVLYLRLKSGHLNHAYPSRANIANFKPYPKDNIPLGGLEVAYRIPFTRRIIEGRDTAVGNGDGRRIQLLTMDLKSAQAVLFSTNDLDRTKREVLNFYLKKYLQFLQNAGHHVLFDLPDFDNDTHRQHIDYSLVSRAFNVPGLQADIEIFGTNIDTINQYLRTTWLDVVSRGFISGPSPDPLANCIYEVRSNTLPSAESHFHITFMPPSIRALCPKEVVFYINISDLDFYGSADFSSAVTHSFKDLKFAFVLDVVQDKTQDITLLQLELGSARFCEHYSTFDFTGEVTFFQQIIKFISEEYLTLLVQYKYHVIFSPQGGFTEEVEFSGISEDEGEWKTVVEASGGVSSKRSTSIVWSEIVRKFSLYSFDHLLAISEESINAMFSSMYTTFSNECLVKWRHTSGNLNAEFRPIKIRLLSNGNALVIFNIDSGSMTLKNGRGTYEFDTWSIAYETRIKMVEHKSITWVDVARERYGRSYIHQIPNVQTVKHIILDFENAVYVGKQSLMPGMWDSDPRSAVARLDSILHFMSGYLKELAYYGHNVIHSIPIFPGQEVFGLTDATFRVISKETVTVANCVQRHTSPVLVVFGMTGGRRMPDRHIPWGFGWVFPRSHGSLCISKEVFLESRLLPSLARINARTTVVPRFPEEDEEEWKVYLTTWDQHRYRKEKSCNWTLLEGNADWLEYGWEHRDEWKYEHSGTQETTDGFSVLCHTKNQLVLPTTFHSALMEIKLKGQSILRVKDIKKQRTKETKANWSATIVIKTDSTGLRVTLSEPVAPYFEHSESEEMWTSFNTDTALKQHLPKIIDVESALSDLRQLLEGSWRWGSAGLGTYTLASPVFTRTGDLIFQLRQTYGGVQSVIGSELMQYGRRSLSNISAEYKTGKSVIGNGNGYLEATTTTIRSQPMSVHQMERSTSSETGSLLSVEEEDLAFIAGGGITTGVKVVNQVRVGTALQEGFH